MAPILGIVIIDHERTIVTTCVSVTYEVKENIQGVNIKFNIEGDSKGWTPIERCKVIPKNQAGDGFKIVYKAEVLPNLYHTK